MRLFPVFAIVFAACGTPEPVAKKPKPAPIRQIPPPTFIDQAPARLVALGDVHGDFLAARDALRLANVVDQDNHWSGGETVVVQVGDQTDRGDKDRKILDWFEELGQEAFDAGGGFYSILGNHEIMNIELDFRYVTEGGFAAFADFDYDPEDPLLADLEDTQRGRAAAFRPGGAYALTLAQHNVVMVIGDTAFVHGGIKPDHVAFGLEKLNQQAQKWMADERSTLPRPMDESDGPLWTRLYSDDEEAPPDCETLAAALAAIPAKRMVVAHTVQDEINAACDEQVWRVDVGMSSYYGGTPQAIEIVDGNVKILK